MGSLPTITTIQASDAPRYTGRLREILQTLKKEKRVENFTVLSIDEDLFTRMKDIGGESLLLIVLTSQISPRKEQLEQTIKTLKEKHPGIKIAEIIVDNVPYENEFITFPVDLRPIRDRMDMDAAWDGIERGLKELFPVKKVEKPVSGGYNNWLEHLKLLKFTGKLAVIYIVLVFASFGILVIGILFVLSELLGFNLQEPGPLLVLTFLTALVVAFFLTKRIHEKQLRKESDTG